MPFSFAKSQYIHILDFLTTDDQHNVIIEVGAMDGKSFDALYPYIRKINQSIVIFIEPLKEYYEKLKDNYSDIAKDSNHFFFENCAITEYEGSFQISRISSSSIESQKLPAWVAGISSLTPEKNSLLKVEEFKSLIVKEEVKGSTFKAIKEKYKITHIDIIQIDTEGYDLIVLKQVLDVILPNLICFEWINLSQEEKKFSVKLLKEKDYIIFLNLDGEDMIACQRNIYLNLSLDILEKYSLLLIPIY